MPALTRVPLNWKLESSNGEDEWQQIAKGRQREERLQQTLQYLLYCSCQSWEIFFPPGCVFINCWTCLINKGKAPARATGNHSLTLSHICSVFKRHRIKTWHTHTFICTHTSHPHCSCIIFVVEDSRVGKQEHDQNKKLHVLSHSSYPYFFTLPSFLNQQLNMITLKLWGAFQITLQQCWLHPRLPNILFLVSLNKGWK